MCKFKSLIVTKNKKVYYLLNSESHINIIEYYGLSDNTDNQDNMIFARVEISPPVNNPFADVNDWILTIDEKILPIWFSPAHCTVIFNTIKNNYCNIIKNVTINCNYLKNKLPYNLIECGNIYGLENYYYDILFLKKCRNLYLKDFKFSLPNLKKCRNLYGLDSYKFSLLNLEECELIDVSGYKYELPNLKKCRNIFGTDEYNYADNLLKQLTIKNE